LTCTFERNERSVMPVELREDDPLRKRLLGQWPVQPTQLGKAADTIRVHELLRVIWRG
jgi:hypothetical protein